MSKSKRFKPRLPAGVVQKLSDNTGGGEHRKKKGKGSYRRREKHAGKTFREMDVSFPILSSSSHGVVDL